ncbi:MAG: ComF family protein [Clostridia bacterium]|nr:ComF family protein [Clostridia bacterium]
MYGVQKLLKYIEGNTEKCIFCDRRKSNISIKGDGVGICSSCYEMYAKDCIKDYFDTKSQVRRLFAPFIYEGELRRAILELKFGGCRAYAKPLGELVAEVLPLYYLYSDYDMLLPVPLHPNRLKERGFNQAELIAEALSEKLLVPMYDDVLFRIRDTKRQASLSRAMRQKNVEGAFYADGIVAGKRIMLVDDIYTAGATIKACSKELIEKGAAEVSAIVVSANFIKDYTDTPQIQIPVIK